MFGIIETEVDTFVRALESLIERIESLGPKLSKKFFGGSVVAELKELRNPWVHPEEGAAPAFPQGFDIKLLQTLMYVGEKNDSPEKGEEHALIVIRVGLADVRRHTEHGSSIYCGLHDLEGELLAREVFLHGNSAC